MDQTPDNIRAMRNTLVKDFREGYSTAPVFWPQLATRVVSNGPANDYAWAAHTLGDMNEWIGPRVVENLVTSSYTIKNKTWEKTLGVRREDIEDDNLGIYSERAAMMGESCAKHADKLILTLLKDGESLECFDGQSFFDTDHPVSPVDASKGVYQNYWASGKALTQANFEFAMAQFSSFKNEGGQHMGLSGGLLVVPPALRGTATEIVKSQIVPNSSGNAGVSNRTLGWTEMVVLDELGGEDTTWYLIAKSRFKPFVYQVRRGINFAAKTALTDDIVLEENEYRFYADCRDNAGFTFPFLCLKLVA